MRFDDDGTIEVRHCWTEMGQGVHTVALPGRSRGARRRSRRGSACIVDTTRELGAGQTTGSRGTLMGAGAVKARVRGGACRGVRVRASTTRASTASTGRTRWREGLENPIIHSTFGYAAQLVVIDRESGIVDKVVAAHDVGRAVNPLLCEGQIEGSVHMGLGYALTEDFPADADRPSRRT